MTKSTKEEAKKSGGVSIRVVGIVTTIIAILLAFFAFTLAGFISDAETTAANQESRYVLCSNAISDLQAGSDYLTTQARMFVITGRRDYLDAYMNEYAIDNRRGMAVDVLKANLPADQSAVSELEKALETSNILAKREFTAMRLAAEYYGIGDLPEEVATADLSVFPSPPQGDARIEAARDLVLGEVYDGTKKSIFAQMKASSNALLDQLEADAEQYKNHVQGLLFQLRIAIALLLCVIMVFVLALFMYVLKPLGHYVERLNNGDALEPDGAYELHYLANAYNAIYEDNNKRIEHLRQYAEQDPLTGISNRAGYDSFLATHTRDVALLLIDIDDFKEFNSVYGDDTGDAVLVKLAEALGTAFRSTDFPCRIEGDLFAVVMTNMSTESRNAILTKMDLVNSYLADDESELPTVTLSVGAAFSTEGMDDREIYEAARTALQQAKQDRSGSVIFYGESNAAE